jgi:Protein of unknown function (DUF3761)
MTLRNFVVMLTLLVMMNLPVVLAVSDSKFPRHEFSSTNKQALATRTRPKKPDPKPEKLAAAKPETKVAAKPEEALINRGRRGRKPPPGATAQCIDLTYSFSKSNKGTCSDHGGVLQWLKRP